LPTGITSSVTQNITVSTAGGLIVPTSTANWFGTGSGTGGNAVPTTNNTGSIGSGITSMAANNTINVTSNNTSGTAHPNIPPIIGVTYLLRVL
jgi:hypothetical protein